ncbi:transcriptional regulator PpsR [uncultured Sulfitobacter sp.]|uniref:transcriptional regulator PpsR n=1 Tax=uncultured Sulfitobacter sp. TaxID=191468 RepID=UPI0026158D73|nr:transcriptional regulator PpsR [uncultured Sulfitobacter sp.]
MMSQGEMTWTSGLIPMIEPEIVSEIISRIADLALVVSSTGTVLGVLSNPNFKMHSGVSRWEGQSLRDHLTVESLPKFEDRFAEFLEGNGAMVRPIELNHSANGAQQEFPMRYSFHRIGTDGAILMLGQDLRPVAEMQQQLVAAQIALEKDYEAQREYETRLRVLMAATDRGTLFVTLSQGEIVDCNPAAMSMLDKQRGDLVGANLAEMLETPGDYTMIETLTRIASSQSGGEVRVRTVEGRAFILRPTVFRTTGEQMLLCQIMDEEGASVRSDVLDEQLTGLFERSTDGIIFVSKAGQILSANEAFLRLTDAVHAQAVKGRVLTDFLGRGSVDFNVIVENATRTGAMRLYATRLIGENGVEVPVEISTARLTGSKETVFAMVVRDASRAEMVRKSSQQITDVDMRSVIELIGSQTLKGIVAKTTDVIEKMCIETAVELTSNNRVAAAEMLGLSRQSLYVKLRKYDLLKKDPEEHS